MKKCIALILLLLAIPVFALADVCEYSVLLPEGYDTGDTRFPVIYVLPEDGYAADSQLAAKLSEGIEAIIVAPSFAEGGDVSAALSALVAEVDGAYRTLADSEHRALAGAGVGGYLAYAAGLADESRTFSILASVRGNFAGEDNPYIAQYGSVYERIEALHAANPDFFNSIYTYMDAPVDDAFTGMSGSTADLGALFIGYGTGSAAHEFTLRPGGYDEAFLSESAARIADRIAARLAPKEEAAPEPPARIEQQPPVIDGDYQSIDLGGDWFFLYTGAEDAVDAASLTKAEYETWPAVQPAAGNWTNGYGNISEKNVSCLYGPDYFDFFIVGAGYYAKTFTVQENFTAQDLTLSIGYVDDRCEVFLNGQRVGATGMDENGQPTGETTWALYSRFAIDPAILNIGGENTVVVRAWNDVPMGAGGWYGGPIGLYSEAAFADVNPEKANDRFYEETFVSQYAASALGQGGEMENKYLIYLPEGYAQSTRRYPTVYLLHQFNSDHTSYKTDKVNELLDAGIASGAFDEMIVVIPNSDGNSWWAGDWEKMITEELIPHIDKHYRTIRDARYRLTAGCSMGGQGAMAVALRNPDDFTGAVSFFGAFSYGGASSPNAIAAAESAEYMDSFALYFICGNQDSYGFGVPAIELHSQLDRLGADHGFFIENGGHDSAFYVPYFEDAFSYVRKAMYQYDGACDALFSGSVNIDRAKITATVTADASAADLIYAAKDSSYTKNDKLQLSVPLVIEIRQEGRDDQVIIADDTVMIASEMTASAFIDAAKLIDADQPFEVTVKVQLFDREIVIAQEG